MDIYDNFPIDRPKLEQATDQGTKQTIKIIDKKILDLEKRIADNCKFSYYRRVLIDIQYINNKIQKDEFRYKIIIDNNNFFSAIIEDINCLDTTSNKYKHLPKKNRQQKRQEIWNTLMQKNGSFEILLGQCIEQECCVCLHKAIFCKVFFDFLNIDIAFIIGYRNDENNHWFSHAWNIYYDKITVTYILIDIAGVAFFYFNNINHHKYIKRYYSNAKLFKNLCKQNDIKIGK